MNTRVIVMIVVAALLIGAGGYVGYLFLDQPAPKTSKAKPSDASKADSAKADDSSVDESATADEAPPENAKLPVISGTAADDTLWGTDAAERINAATDADPQGKDSVDAGAGDDKIYADAGDSVQGGAGHDELVVRGAAGMSLKLAGTGIEETWGGEGDDTFDGTGVADVLKLRGGAGGDKLTGGSAGDTLFGGDGDDTLAGGPGDDILKGEAGTDTLTGGPGADFFNYARFDGSTDTVTDYSFADGDTINAASFAVHGKDTWLLDADGKTLLILKDYNGGTQGIAAHK